jgi:hypothetical protein
VNGDISGPGGCFMRRRATAGATVGSPRPTRTTQQPATRHPSEIDGGKQFPFLAQLYLPPGIFRSIWLTDDQVATTELRAPTVPGARSPAKPTPPDATPCAKPARHHCGPTSKPPGTDGVN